MTDGIASQIAQLQSEIAALKQALATLAALPDAQRPLLEQLADKERQLAALTVATSPAGPSVTAPLSAARDVNIATSQTIINQGGSNDPDRATLLREYLLGLSGACNRLSLADADSSDPTRAAVELAAVYTRLEVARTVPLSDQDRQGRIRLEKERQQTALEALAAQPRLVLLGDPGSGKSTFVNFTGLCLARAAFGEAGWLEQLRDAWPHGALLPIRIVLREFAAWLATQPQFMGRSGVAPLYAWLTEHHGAALVAVLREAITSGQVLLLLDGLDEVPVDASGQPLKQVIYVVEMLASAAGASRILVTCRALDYQQPQRQIPRWHTETLIPFSDDLRQEFIGRWFDVLARLDRPLNGDPAALREGLRAEVRDRPELRRLAGNPLLLTMMTLLHAYEGRLPEERVRLYEKCIEFLLHHWRPPSDSAALRERLHLPQWSDSDMGRLLDRLGFAAHERGVSGDGEAGADLPRPVLIETARAFFAAYDPEQGYTRAEEFCRYISRYGNGVLQPYGPEIYRFPHRTFQEYLAARRLTSDGDWSRDDAEFVDRALARASGGPQWREALLLAVSRLVVLNGQTRPAADLAEALLDQHPARTPAWARNATLAGETLAEVGRERLGRLGPRHAALWERAVAALVEILEYLDTDGQPIVPVNERVRAGFLLGDLGDPRYPITIEQWRAELAKVQANDASGYFCRVEAGSYIIGSGDDDPNAEDSEKPQHTVIFDAPFWIGRYPITNEQWRAQFRVGGEPYYFADDDDRLRPNQPVAGMSWHMCNGFCTWLGEQIGIAARLPAETEWEAAARGGDARRYPWGADWRDDRAATEEDEQARGGRYTVPVGCYPAGAARCGALDLAGNVWEWTADTWRSYPGAQKPFTDDRLRVLRGGSWVRSTTNVRCGARLWSNPVNDFPDYGLRIVVAPHSH